MLFEDGSIGERLRAGMPLYGCLLLLKPQVERAAIVELLSRLRRRVYSLNGAVTDIKSFGKVYLGYGIKKLDGRYSYGLEFVNESESRGSFYNKYAKSDMFDDDEEGDDDDQEYDVEENSRRIQQR